MNHNIRQNYKDSTENKWKPPNENEEQTLGIKEDVIGKLNGT